jgi:hypothetical protein
MKLDDKITTLEMALMVPEIKEYQYSSDPDSARFWCVNMNVLVPSASDEEHGSHFNATYLPRHLWWVVRERARFERNTVAYGSILQRLWNYERFNLKAPKPNPKDPMKVDWFPDGRAAMAERPVTTSLAKFVASCAPVYSDEYIRDLDASYRASMSNEIELLAGIENLRKAYLEGPSSCMSKMWHIAESEHGKLFDGNHPVDAYDTPGIFVAVGRDGSGRINARCMVYVNPNDPADKRMIRVYGDKSLEGRLIRNGFKYRAFNDGVVLKAIRLPKVKTNTGYEAYCAPYLDGLAGAHSSVDAGKYMVKFIGEDVLRIFNAREFNRAQPYMGDKFPGWANTGNADGHMTLRPVKPEDFVMTCAVTGAKFDVAKDDVKTLPVYMDGEVRMATYVEDGEGAVFATFPSTAFLYTEGNASPKAVRVKPDVERFSGRYGMTIDTPLARKREGWFKLDPELYPERIAEWVHMGRNITENAGHVVINGYAVARIDAMQCLDKPEDESYTQMSWVRKKDMGKVTRVHRVKRDVPLYATDRVKIVKTVTGRLVVPGYHEVIETWNGRWAFNRNIVQFEMLGSTRYATKDEVGDARVLRSHRGSTPIVEWMPPAEVVEPMLAERAAELAKELIQYHGYEPKTGPAFTSRAWDYFLGMVGQPYLDNGSNGATFSYLRWHAYRPSNRNLWLNGEETRFRACVAAGGKVAYEGGVLSQIVSDFDVLKLKQVLDTWDKFLPLYIKEMELRRRKLVLEGDIDPTPDDQRARWYIEGDANLSDAPISEQDMRARVEAALAELEAPAEQQLAA